MLNYVYDGSFEGLLTAIHEAYYRNEKPDKILSGLGFQENLLDRSVHIATDTEKAKKVYEAIRQKISPYALDNVFYVFLSELEGAGTWIYNYLRLGWKVGREVDLRLADDRVLIVHDISRKVRCERHRMLGLLRFELFEGGIYYASMEPDYNIAALLAPHFAKRLADQNWVIHDVRRNIAAVFNRTRWAVVEAAPTMQFMRDRNETEYQKLWRQYFKSIAISSRINPRLQRRFMPVRYWRHLVEK